MTRTGRALTALSMMLGLVSGCARGPDVSAQLPLRRVVVYRNGVGYFERMGRVKSDRVDFQVRGREVGDFLATLAVFERGGSSVRAASFPIKPIDEADESSPPPPVEPAPTSDSEGHAKIAPRPPDAPPDNPPRKKLEKVVLELDGKEHDLQVGYIAETPVWRPSYRLVVHAGTADLQAWGIVQNLSGEDWNNVTLSLVAGAPLAFEASLGTPIIPDRPTVTDSGEVIAAVPRSETTLQQEPASQIAPPPPPPAPAAEPMMEKAELEDGAPAGRARPMSNKEMKKVAGHASFGAGAGGGGRATRAAAPRSTMAADEPAMAMAPAPPPRQNPSAPRNLSALAAVAVEGGATRYDIPAAITVPDKSATMVMLLSKQVKGEAIYLFAPDGGVADSLTHPFRVARFANQTGGLLERGPIAIFEEGAFLGQGMIDPLPIGATATVPFALERSLAVEQTREFDEQGARIKQIEAGTLTIAREAVTKTKYRVRNGGDKLAKLLVKHARAGGTNLFQPPKGTEDNVGTGTALVPVEVPAHGTGELLVDERLDTTRVVDWLSPLADEAIHAYWADRRADGATVGKLKQAWDVRESLNRANDERAKLASEKSELENSTEETRNNLKAIEKNKLAADLRQKLTDRLAKNALRLDEITKRLIELDQQINEQRVRFTEMIRGIKLV